ncbi:MAG: dienelactone hydrolase family protein [Rhodospirillales bacterium]|nr:dienelactone hydrolase family protein [Rhodospirillales bacterium]
MDRSHAGDGHGFKAWRATPEAPRRAIIVLQEIFGVNGHIRSDRLVDGFAADGYDTIAPSLYSRGFGRELDSALLPNLWT